MLYRHVSMLIIGMFCGLLYPTPMLHADVIQSEKHRVHIEVVAKGLQHPWGMVFLPQGDILVTERPGRLRLIKDGKLLETPITGVPSIIVIRGNFVTITL